MGLAGAQLRLHLLLLFDAEDDPAVPVGPAFGVEMHLPPRAQPATPPIRQHDTVFDLVTAAVPQHAFNGVGAGLAVVRVDEILGRGKARQTFSWNTEEAAAGLRSADAAGGNVQRPDADTDLVEGLPEVLGRQRFAAPPESLRPRPWKASSIPSRKSLHRMRG